MCPSSLSSASSPAERRRQPPGPSSPLARNAPACVCSRAAAWRLPRDARGRRVAGLSPAPSRALCAVHPFLSGSPPVLPPVLSRVRRAALASSDRAWVIRGRLCRSCHWISNPIGRRAPLPDHQRPPHGSLYLMSWYVVAPFTLACLPEGPHYQIFSPRETRNDVEKTGGARENAEELEKTRRRS